MWKRIMGWAQRLGLRGRARAGAKRPLDPTIVEVRQLSGTAPTKASGYRGLLRPTRRTRLSWPRGGSAGAATTATSSLPVLLLNDADKADEKGFTVTIGHIIINIIVNANDYGLEKMKELDPPLLAGLGMTIASPMGIVSTRCGSGLKGRARTTANAIAIRNGSGAPTQATMPPRPRGRSAGAAKTATLSLLDFPRGDEGKADEKGYRIMDMLSRVHANDYELEGTKMWDLLFLAGIGTTIAVLARTSTSTRCILEQRDRIGTTAKANTEMNGSGTRNLDLTPRGSRAGIPEAAASTNQRRRCNLALTSRICARA